MTDEDVVAKVATLFNVGYRPSDVQRSQEHSWKQAYVTKITGQNAVRWMKLLYPLMGQRRREQIDKALAGYKGDARYVLPQEQVEELKRRLQNGEHVITLAKEFGVSKSYAYYIKSGRY
jgi:hypothetical protein